MLAPITVNNCCRLSDVSCLETYAYVYDTESKLTEIRTDTSATLIRSCWRITWLYDGLGRVRVRTDYTWSGSAWAVSETVRYLYDGMRVIQERNASNTPTVSHTRGWDLSGSLEGAGGIGGLLGRSHGYSSGTWSTHNHYHADGNGNVTFLVNSGQTAEAWYRYDPYGRTMAQSATALTTANVYRFSSKEIHAQSGMYYYGFRFYDPHLQRWPNRDPIVEAGGVNLYGFVMNDPVDVIDKFGQLPLPLPPINPCKLCAYAVAGAAMAQVDASANIDRYGQDRGYIRRQRVHPLSGRMPNQEGLRCAGCGRLGRT